MQSLYGVIFAVSAFETDSVRSHCDAALGADSVRGHFDAAFRTPDFPAKNGYSLPASYTPPENKNLCNIFSYQRQIINVAIGSGIRIATTGCNSGYHSYDC